MARLNPRRRWLAKQEKAQAAIMQAVIHEKSQACDNERLQHGNVKSCVTKFTGSLALRAPRELWEGTGKKGKVVQGVFKPANNAKSRWGQQ